MPSPHVKNFFSIKPHKNLLLSAEGTWEEWSTYPKVLSALKVLVALDVTPPMVVTDYRSVGFSNIINYRFGAEGKITIFNKSLSLRGGYGFFPTPIPEQNGLTSYADNDRHLFAMGIGTTLENLKPYLLNPVRLSFSLGWHQLVNRATVKSAPEFPGESFSSGGSIFQTSFSLSLDF